MTSLERAMAVIRGQIPDRVPTDLHNFLMASRMAGIPLSKCLQSGELMAESHLVAWRHFGHDMILVENGTTAVAQAMGSGIIFTDDQAPRVIDPVLKSLDDIDKLRIPDPERDFPLPEVLKAISILRQELGDKVFIMEGGPGPDGACGSDKGARAVLPRSRRVRGSRDHREPA